MRTHARWITAVLLLAVAFLAGPELLDDPPRPAVAATQSVAEHDQRASDDLDGPSWSADRVLASRRRLPALAPSLHDHSPTVARRPAGPAPSAAVPARVRAAGRPYPGDARSPEILQVFRC